MQSNDTIIANSSAVGWAGRMIVRMSGPATFAIARKIVDELPPPGGAGRSRFHVGSFDFFGSIYLFASPHSYTGDDLVEFHLPGNPLLANNLMAACLKRGARAAEPGEFTARAYFNGKMDLTQAEGVAATIAASNEEELCAARQLLAGELANRLRPIMELLIETLALIEAGIDFADEQVSFIQVDDLRDRISTMDQMLRDLQEKSPRFEPLSAQAMIVLIGRPNAGKSTLLNALARYDRAVVSPIAGTTRDAISADVALEHGIIKLVDVAGIECNESLDHLIIESLPDMIQRSDDSMIQSKGIERQMQERARRMAQSADVIVSVVEAVDDSAAVDVGRSANLRVRTKMDLGGKIRAGELAISALTGLGMDELRRRLDDLAFGSRTGGATLALNHRHIEAIKAARTALSRAQSAAELGHELIAMDLREALDSIGSILGVISPDELLGQIFSRFCIGK